MSGSILVVTFDTSTGIRTGKLVDGALLADQAVLSGKIASGAIWTPDIADLAVTSAKLAAAIIASITAGGVADESITSAKLASGAVIGPRVAFRGIWSGMLQSGAIAGDTIANLAIVSTHIAVGVVGDALLKAYGVLSGKIASGGVIADVIANRGILSGKLTSGATLGDVVADRGVWSGKIASGAIAGDAIASWGIASGTIASGIVTEQQLISGISVDIAEFNQDPNYYAGEAVSNFCCVFVAALSGNWVKVAKALSGSMPAIGLTVGAIASGTVGVINYGGRVAAPSVIVSGQMGRPVFVGTDGQLAVISGKVPGVSGYCQQIMGVVKDNAEIQLFPEPGHIELT